MRLPRLTSSQAPPQGGSKSGDFEKFRGPTGCDLGAARFSELLADRNSREGFAASAPTPTKRRILGCPRQRRNGTVLFASAGIRAARPRQVQDRGGSPILAHPRK